MYSIGFFFILVGAIVACFSVISGKRAPEWDIAGFISPVVFIMLFLQQLFEGNKVAVLAASLISAGVVLLLIASKT